MKQPIYEDYLPANPIKKTSTPAPVPAPAPTPVSQTDSAITKAEKIASAQAASAAYVTQVIAAAVINSPVVINTPADTPPSPKAVQKVAQEIAAVVVPVIAPTLPPTAVQTIVQATTQAVVTNPEVKAADVGQTVPPAVVEKIAETVIQAPAVVQAVAPITVAQSSAITKAEKIAATLAKQEEASAAFGADANFTTPIVPTQTTPTAVVPEKNDFIPYFTPSVKMPTPVVKPGDLGFVGPVGVTDTEAPLSQEEFDALIEEGNAAAIAGDTLLAEGNAAAIAAGLKPIDFTPGNIIGPTPAKPVEDPTYVALLKAMEVYNISGLAATLDKIRADYPNINSEDMLTLLRNDTRYNAEYNKRFSANAARVAAGKAPLDEKTYLGDERKYADIFTKYDVPQFATTDQYTKLIAGGIDPDKVETRISMGYNRVINNPSTLEAFQKFYKQISMGEIVGALIAPEVQMPALERKITTAEVGGAALRQGLSAFEAATNIQSQRYSNVMGGTIGAGAIAASGESGPQATADYQKIAQDLPRMEFLSSISKGLPQYGQQEAEKADILGLASEQRKKEDILAAERARWQGSAGAAQGAFSTGYLKKSSSAGAF